MVLEWTPEEASLLQDQPFSAAALVYRCMGNSEPPDIFQHQSTGYLSLGPGDRRLCVPCVVHTNLQLHYYSTI